MSVFLIVIFITMLAFVLNTGYLFSKRNLYQSIVESAAMAGATGLCEGDPIQRAMEIISKSGISQALAKVKVGYYDDTNGYFWEEGSSNYPDGEYNNAVLVEIENNEQVIMKNFLNKKYKD